MNFSKSHDLVSYTCTTQLLFIYLRQIKLLRMIEINVPKEANGYVYTIKDIKLDAMYKCPSSCYYVGENFECSLRQCIQRGVKRIKEFKALAITINVKNMSNKNNWYVGAEDVILVDEDGYTYKGVILCNYLLPHRTAEDKTLILPHTQLDYIELFPLLPENIRISSARVNIYNTWVEFSLSDTPSQMQLLADQNKQSNQNDVQVIVDTNKHWIIEKFKERIAKLRTSIYSRLNNVLTSSEKTKLENKIGNEHYSISMELREKNDPDYTILLEELEEMYSVYHQKLQDSKEIEQKRKSLSQKVDELLELSPRDFEEYVSQLLKHLGYSNIELTPYVNDKGIDVIAYKDELKYVVQCKRYKGTVGSPDIQTFLGAMSHAQADKGLFITTGMFSFEAEKMAAEHPIVLINRIDLAKLVFNALSGN